MIINQIVSTGLGKSSNPEIPLLNYITRQNIVRRKAILWSPS